MNRGPGTKSRRKNDSMESKPDPIKVFSALKKIIHLELPPERGLNLSDLAKKY